MVTRLRGVLLALLLASVLWLAVDAEGAVPELAYRGCLADDAGPGDCVDLPGSPLKRARDLVVSPDGRFIHAVGSNPGTLATFRRGPDGVPTYVGCLSNRPGRGCTVLSGGFLDGASALALSPDGSSLYVVATAHDSIAHFFRDPESAALSFGGCLSNGGDGGCGALGYERIPRPSDVLVGPDGSSVYVGADGVVAGFKRFPAGQVEFSLCLAGNPAAACGSLGETTIDGRTTLARAGDLLLVAAAASDSLATFPVGPNGHLVFGVCVSDRPSPTCEMQAGGRLDGASGIATAGDGRWIHVSAAGAGTLVQFERVPGQSRPVFSSCLAGIGSEATGCGRIAGLDLRGARSPSLSADGTALALAAEDSNSVVAFNRDPGLGTLSFAACQSADSEQSSLCTYRPTMPLWGPGPIALAPDGGSLHALAPAINGLLSFAPQADLPPPAVDPPPPPAPAAAPPAPPRCLGRPATIVGTPGRDILRGTRGDDVIAALGGADVVRGRGGDDLICGGPGADRLAGGAGRDRLLGRGGRDRCDGGPGRDEARCELVLRSP